MPCLQSSHLVHHSVIWPLRFLPTHGPALICHTRPSQPPRGTDIYSALKSDLGAESKYQTREPRLARYQAARNISTCFFLYRRSACWVYLAGRQPTSPRSFPSRNWTRRQTECLPSFEPDIQICSKRVLHVVETKSWLSQSS